MTTRETDQRTTALARTLKDGMDREAGHFARLCGEIESLRESMQARSFGTGLAIAQAIERSAAVIEGADEARSETFALLRDHLGLPQATAFSAVLPALPEEVREELEASWRQLRVSLVRLKTATSRMKYSAEALAGALNSIVEQVFPYRKGRIYSRRGTPTAVAGALLVDRKL